MNPDRQQAIDYLRAPPRGLWHWAENGGVLVWHDGTTIAFRQEIVQIIEWLAPNGLPSFGALAFLLAACKGKVPAVHDVVSISSTPLPPSAGKDAVLLVSAREQLKAQLESALAQLAKLSKLPSEVTSSLHAKCFLAEAIFEPAKVERYVEARVILRGMRETMNDEDLTDQTLSAVSGSYIRQVHIVAQGLKPHTADSLSLRMHTGLDTLPKEADINLPSAERARRLIEELSQDRELGAIGRAARELMAAVRLPRRLGERENLAVGGLADITNRGPLDRLLLSELAHDDLTLSVRVALNEALYLRREPPMREPPGTLSVLMDSGIRLWGVPRVLAASIALALVARDKQHHELQIWRAHGKDLKPVDLLSRNGLIEHLGALEPRAHAGESLPAFAKGASSGPQNQSVLVTHPDALADPEFRRALAENPDAPGFVATVDREGKFELHSLPLARRPALCEADLDLDSIFAEPARAATLKTGVEPDLPAIFGVSPFPLLLPLAGKIEFWTRHESGLCYATLNDRRLVQFRDQRVGGRVLGRELPGGRTVWMDCAGEELHVVRTSSRQRPARLLTFPLPHGPLRVSDLASGPETRAVHRYGDVIVVIRRYDLRAYSLEDGRLLDQIRNPHTWVNGRYFRGERRFYFAAWNGTRISLEPVTIPSTVLLASIGAIFDRPGMPGPWLLIRSGKLVSSETGEVVKLPPAESAALDYYSPRFSVDGQSLYVPVTKKAPNQKTDHCIIGLGQEITLDFMRIQDWELHQSPKLPSRNLYRIVESVAARQDGVALCGRKNRWRKLSLESDGKLRISDVASHGPASHRQSFSGQYTGTNHGCSLQKIQYPNGSRIFLDSRGLLHFKSWDSNLPEISLVLADGEVAGWTSDGHVCGPAFFFEGPFTSKPEAVFERLMKFFSRL